MKLKEKFKIINCTDCDMPYCDVKCTILSNGELDALEQIADEFAIGFAKWCLDIGIYTQFKKTQGVNKELLEIYKKEKGL